jgi:hypothetical protein
MANKGDARQLPKAMTHGSWANDDGNRRYPATLMSGLPVSELRQGP